MTTSDLHTETVTYRAGDTALQGYLAYDLKQSGERPGVMVIHEWWGLNDYIKRRAQMLAELGYTALAIDMYGNGKTATHPDEAGALMNEVLNDMDSATARLQAAYDCLQARPQTDANKVAAMGYCFGGAAALHGARIGMNLAGVVSFHGALGSFHKPEPGTVKARILVCHGAADALIPADDIDAFKQEMDDADADYQFIAYNGALHGFTNPQATENGRKYGLPLAYDAEADEQSWQTMQAFFKEIFA